MEKKFLSETKEGVVNQTWWPYRFAGSTRNAGAELKQIFSGVKTFDTPKPRPLIERILELSTHKNADCWIVFPVPELPHMQYWK